MKYNERNKPLVCMQTQSTCYKGTRTMKVLGVLWHSTGANNPNLKRYVQPSDDAPDRAEMLALLGMNSNKNDWNHITRQAGLNCWIGKLADGTVTTVQTMPWDYKPWGCGSGSKGSCNNGWIQFEICEDALTDASYFAKAYAEACEITAYLCKLYGIDPNGTVDFNGVKVPTILCHADSHRLGLGSNHGDVLHWFPKFGKSMETVRADVAKLLKGTNESTQPASETGMVSTASDAKAIWDRLLAFIGNPYGVAGVMGNMQAESGLRSNNLQNTYEKSLSLSDEAYTKAVDDGSYTNFVKDKAGYGLVQWTFWSLKEGLLNYARSVGKSIGDWQMQVDFFLKEMAEDYPAILKVLKNAASVREASDAVLLKFERPADQGTSVQEKRAAFGQSFFDKYAVAAPAERLTSGFYRVRLTWENAKSQKGAYRILANAKKTADTNPGYFVFDPDGQPVYPVKEDTPAEEPPTSESIPVKVPFLVRVSISDLNIRTGPGTNNAKTGRFTGKGVFTIVAVQSGQGSDSGWGKLKSGAGWISLDYCTKL